MRIVLDTNVLVSALAFPGSKPDQVLRLVRRQVVDLFLSPFILSEFGRVLRDKFALSAREADARVRSIRRIAHIVEPKERVTAITANEDDNRIIECAIGAEADFLVTGDKAHLLPLGTYRTTRIVTPAQLLDMIALS